MTNNKKPTNKTNPQPVNKEAFCMLAKEIGLPEACRKLGVPIPTAKSWKKRYGWELPRRKTGRPERSLPASGNASSLHPIADALDASHKELEDATRTALAQAIYKALKNVASKEPLDITNPAQLQAVAVIALREKLLEPRPAMITLPAQPTQLQASVDTGNTLPAPAEEVIEKPDPAFSAPAGATDPNDAIPAYRAWLEHQAPEHEPESENEISVGL